MIQKVYIGLGSNLGDRLENFHQVLGRFPSTITINRVSPVYETDPWGYNDQPAFLNQVVEVSTVLAPLELLQELKHLEELQGRAPTFRYGPRRIDLDILLYNNMVYNRAGLIIPHIHMHERAFVLVPLADLAPDLHGGHRVEQEGLRDGQAKAKAAIDTFFMRGSPSLRGR